MRHSHIIKINARGGIFTPKGLQSVVEAAFKADTKQINFGPRQEIFFNVHKEKIEPFVNAIEKTGMSYELDNDIHPNIVSSYPAEGIFSGDYWLSEGIYKDIFDQFDFQPGLKVNIVDNDQCLVPFFSGELNFIASSQYNYWHLFINIKKLGKVFRWDRLIYSTDIAKISREIEELYLNNHIKNSSEIMGLVNGNAKYLFIETNEELSLPRFVFPYYEGMNRYGNKFWLGIYRRDFLFPIAFVYELCQLCISTKIGQICITPWRTILVKGIDQKDRILWEKLLGKHGINLRHSATELNWVIEDVNSPELELKNYIVNKFDQEDIRTFGLVFGIKVQSDSYIPASVIIEENPFIHKDAMRLFSSFSIYHTDNFNPNSLNKILYAKGISKQSLAGSLLELCKKYYAQLNEEISNVITEELAKPVEKVNARLYQCQHCFTIYDEQYGDDSQGIMQGTTFSNLPNTYQCPTCEASKESYIERKTEEKVFKT